MEMKAIGLLLWDMGKGKQRNRYTRWSNKHLQMDFLILILDKDLHMSMHMKTRSLPQRHDGSIYNFLAMVYQSSPPHECLLWTRSLDRTMKYYLKEGIIRASTCELSIAVMMRGP